MCLKMLLSDTTSCTFVFLVCSHAWMWQDFLARDQIQTFCRLFKPSQIFCCPRCHESIMIMWIIGCMLNRIVFAFWINQNGKRHFHLFHNTRASMQNIRKGSFQKDKSLVAKTEQNTEQRWKNITQLFSLLLPVTLGPTRLTWRLSLLPTSVLCTTFITFRQFIQRENVKASLKMVFAELWITHTFIQTCCLTKGWRIIFNGTSMV